MARERGLSWGGHQWPPTGAPHYHHHHHHHPPRHDPRSLTMPGVADDAGSQYEYDSVNAVSFGFVATAVLISMFLIMALFEKLLRPSPSDGGARQRVDLEARSPAGKLGHPSPKMTVYDDGLSVLMPGDDFPSYIAHPAPVPCLRENILWPSHRPDAPSCGLLTDPMPHLDRLADSSSITARSPAFSTPMALSCEDLGC